MLPADLVLEFWAVVRRELCDRFGQAERDAESAVSRYRDDLRRRRLDDFVYHREPESVAEVVVGWLNVQQASVAGSAASGRP